MRQVQMRAEIQFGSENFLAEATFKIIWQFVDSHRVSASGHQTRIDGVAETATNFSILEFNQVLPALDVLTSFWFSG